MRAQPLPTPPILALALALLACGGPPSSPVDGGADGGTRPAPTPASTAHCDYAPLPPTARAGGLVAPGPIEAGRADLPLLLPLGAALGGNTSRATAIGNQSYVDGRTSYLSGGFNPSVGVETLPRVKALALRAGEETVLILRTDTIFSNDSIAFELSERLGPEFAGKVLWLSSHTHTAAEQYSSDSKLQVGGGAMRAEVRARLIDRMTQAAEAALADLRPVRLGIATMRGFDPDDRVSYDRRDENDDLFGGEPRKDEFLAVIRIDELDGAPFAILPIFGVHSAILDDDVALFSTDASGAYERVIEEEFDREVLVMHLQGAAGDVLGSSSGHTPIPEGELRWDFARLEENARHALPQILPVWERAGEAMQEEVAMQMLVRSIALGPDWENFRVRGGALAYAPFDLGRDCDRRVFLGDGQVASPIDEFNAPSGAGLCGDSSESTFPTGRMPNTADLVGYHSCARLEVAVPVLSLAIDARFEPTPLCASTRTTVSALRLGDYLFGAAPGEPVVHWAESVREASPVAPENTIVLGYAQGHVGYILRAEDWLRGGFEPSINVWGPLEGEVIRERLLEVMALAAGEERVDAAEGGADRVVPPPIEDALPAPDPAPRAGEIPGALPEGLFLRNHARPDGAQPAPSIPRGGTARFVWIGEDPRVATPSARLEREVGGIFEPVRRRSGRLVLDQDFLITWTPLPLRPTAGEARTHYFALEWEAAAPIGAPEAPGLERRLGCLPLGRYRFHVEGEGYAIDSEPFEVTPMELEVLAEYAGPEQVRVRLRQRAPEGFRLLGMEEGTTSASYTGVRVTAVGRAAGAETFRLEGLEVGAEPLLLSHPAVEASDRIDILDECGNEGHGSYLPAP